MTRLEHVYTMIEIRRGTPNDVPGILALIKELALYERAPEQVLNTEQLLLEDGFGPNSIYSVFVAEDEQQQIVGIALYYTAYSTWKGRIFYLDDIVVTERLRRAGLGRRLLNEVLREAAKAGVNQIRWQVLEWNEPAIAFYKKAGVQLDAEWINCKMSKEQIRDYVNQLV